MNLRSSRHAPQKYDDQDFHDHNQDRVRERTPVKMAEKYCGPVYEFNPNLRPAIFPTIPLDQEVDEDFNVHVLSGQSVRTLQPSQPDRARPLSSTIGRSNPGPGSPPQLESFDFASFRGPHMFASTPNSGRQSHERNKSVIMTPPRSPSPTADNGPGNKVYMENLEMMRKYDKMTEEDWNIAEMATSDEEEPEEQILAWDELTIAHRLDLVDVVDETYNNLEKTFRALRLTRKQRENTIELIYERNEYLDARDDTMQKVEDLVNDILLSGNKHEIDWLTKKNGYDKLMVDNVYQHLKKFDYHTSTGAEYRLAKQYLTYCGFRPGLLNHWTPPSINKAKPTKPSLVTKRNTIVAESSASSQPKPRPALFPTVSIVEPRKRSNPDPPEEAARNALAGRSNNKASIPAAQTPIPTAQAPILAAQIPTPAAQASVSVPHSQADLQPSDTASIGPPSKRPVPRPFESQGHFKRYARAQRPLPTASDGPVDTDLSMIDPALRQQSHTPPIANFSKPQPRGILKNGNRYHVTSAIAPDEVKDQESGRQVQINSACDSGHERQPKNVFTRLDQPVQVTSTNNNGTQLRPSIDGGSENLVMSSDDPRSQALRPQGYQVPPLARAFNLPPQLSQEQHSWLPDTTSNMTRRTSSSDRPSNLSRPRYDNNGVEIPPGRYSNGDIDGRISGNINGYINGNILDNINGNSALRHNSAHPGPMPSNNDPHSRSQGGDIFPARQPTIQDFHNSQHSLIAPNNYHLYGNGNTQVPSMGPMPGNRGRAPPARMHAPSATDPQRSGANATANTTVTNGQG